MRYLYLVLGFFLFQPVFGQDSHSHEISFQIDNYENDTLIIGYYYGNKQLVHDTLFREENSFNLKGEDSLVPAMYLAIMKPKNDFIQFLVPGEDQKFIVRADANSLENYSVEGSTDNALFSEYISFIKNLNTRAGEINSAKGSALSEEEAQKQLQGLTDDLIVYQNKIIKANPSAITSKLIRTNKEIKIPEFEGKPEDINLKKYHYFKDHYFDYIDLSDEDYGKLPYTFQKIENYIDKFTPQHPDSLIISIDFILNSMPEEGDFYRFYLSHFLNKYAKSNIVGMDAIYVHLVDNYYAKNKADWIDEETLYKLKDNAKMLKPTLIGKKAQDVTTFKENGEPTNLYSLDAEFTILYIYAYDCGHCKKSTPPLVDFYEKYKDKGVAIYTICSKPEIDKCWEYTKEKKMDGFINTVDPTNSSRFRTKFDVRQTPKIYILNKEKEILLKGFNTADLDRIMDEIIELEKNKT
jgi:thiol-disulfide isomerase/thioredoxin